MQVRCGKQWVIIDNSVIDVSALQDERSGHKGGDVFSIGEDNTFLFHELHANLPMMPSKHRPDLPSITAHIQEKVRDNIVGILAHRQHEVPLSDAAHPFWTPSERKPPYIEQCDSSLDATGMDAATAIADATSGLEPGTPASRAFWCIVGTLVADAAAQPTQCATALKRVARLDCSTAVAMRLLPHRLPTYKDAWPLPPLFAHTHTHTHAPPLPTSSPDHSSTVDRPTAGTTR